MKAFASCVGRSWPAVAVVVLAVSGLCVRRHAAVVNGQRITEQEAQEASRQILDGAARLRHDHRQRRGRASSWPGFINTVADGAGKGLSDSAARQAVAAIDGPLDPRPSSSSGPASPSTR